MKAILIDASARRIRPAEYKGLPDMHRLIGGYLEAVPIFLGGDTLYVDEDGLHKPQTAFFIIEGHRSPIAGNGLLVGRELVDDEGEFTSNADPVITIEKLTAMVRFQTRAQVDAWGKANAGEPAIGIMTVDRSGVVSSEVLEYYGSLIASIPRPRRSNYGWTTSGGFILIVDHDDGSLSVTNDIERVIEDLTTAGADVGQPIICRDSEGRWDGVLTEHGRFKEFLLLRATSPAEAIVKWPMMRLRAAAPRER